MEIVYSACYAALTCNKHLQRKKSVFYRALTFCTQPLHSAKCNQLDWHCTCNYAPLMKLSVTTQQHNSQVQAQVLCCLFCLLLSIAAQGQACILVHKLWNRHKRYTAHRFKLRVSKYRCATEADRNAKVPLISSCTRLFCWPGWDRKCDAKEAGFQARTV